MTKNELLLLYNEEAQSLAYNRGWRLCEAVTLAGRLDSILLRFCCINSAPRKAIALIKSGRNPPPT
jgi:hypothetical protein